MTTGSASLPKFLLARLGEDEAVAVMARVQIEVHHVGRFGYDRILAECESKRRILEGMRPFGPIDDINADEILRLLALPYASHPDYRKEWRP